ncbi:hypothetical protein E3P92_00996 [Wallemia ichthyophaga]|uniref:Ribosome assembly factor mrt4 n=1 Tax=Wallemia ichthyophaga (strain EXF-994 / CBS 113033) TaxID=1299270 RepID=R9AR73_WALI9|nr:mRNA turnover protein 4-like protein [Wallemia ichthyophaga EXF-994]TIB17272.1 hypothetical protein E3P93_00727 [Wallemia ichthyophaga]EOR04717.1 mRNA turnover protein 4-like protein [Wallemia ichthyophaga EXF-994]TIB17606.1 hypothetical protein E3P92_00996 [Wallemia ichthyophaga]TIB22825.1 hypothetical protein E3P89_01871 [Wallemia ichthyophaga]TIB26728.1 hypothetical protein E3P88_00767 [Wallemia ichthyophaga]
MPKSRRNKLVSLTETEKKTREHKEALVDLIRQAADDNKYCWIIEAGDMRNSGLKDVRAAWKGTGRLFFGRLKVMALALGTTPETSHKPELYRLSELLTGSAGLFFTNWDEKEVKEWFDDFSKPDFARTGNVATSTVELDEGPVIHRPSGDTLPHTLEPALRKLGLSTSLLKGVPTLLSPHTICKEGQTLSAEQAQILKHLGIMMSTFKLQVKAYWNEGNAGEGEIQVLDKDVQMS